MAEKHKQTMILNLHPTPDEYRTIYETLIGYRRAMDILDGTQGANLVALHDEAYEKIRQDTGLPSRLVSLALRDHAGKNKGEITNNFPLDSKLYSIKSADSVSISTISGRLLIKYTVSGYSELRSDFAEARLVFKDSEIRIEVGVNVKVKTTGEIQMANEGILPRLGRVIAGILNNAVDAVETANPLAVAQESVREINKLAIEAKNALGSAIAAKHRLESKAKDLDNELKDISQKINVAVSNNREDLARVAIGRQIDLDAQRNALDQAISQANEEIADAQATLMTITSAKNDAEKRVTDAIEAEKKSRKTVSQSAGAVHDNRLDNALDAVTRVTGVSTPVMSGNAEIAELEKMQRENEIDRRLKKIADQNNN